MWKKFRTLRFVNRVRRQQGAAPISHLPKGWVSNHTDCVIARGIRQDNPKIHSVSVGPRTIVIHGEDGSQQELEVPRPIRSFINEFDNYKYPELVL